MKIRLAIVVSFGLSACCLAQSAQPSQSAQPQDKPVELQHIDVTSVDSSVSPCDNFYRYVCNRFNAANPIPPDQASWGVGGMLALWNRQILRQILEKNEAPSVSRLPNEQKIGDFYAACMNQASSNANDLAAIKPLLDRIAGMRDKHEIAPVVAVLHSSFGQAWSGDDNQIAVPLFGFGPQPDFNDVNRVVAGVDQGGLGMWSRDFYLNDDDNTKKVREKYTALIVALLKMDGATPAQAAEGASTILRMETAMAKAQIDNVTRRDPNKMNNRYTLAQLRQLAPLFDWDSYFRGLGAPEVSLYEVTWPDYFRAMNQLLAAEDLATWKLYLRWHLLFDASRSLGNAWRDAYFSYDAVLTGRKEQAPAWRRCTAGVDGYLGEALGQVYVAQVFPPESKARAQKMVKDIEAAMGRDIASVTWMQPATKQEAQLKLAAVIDKIGYPDRWIDYSSYSVTRESYPLNIERGTAFEFKRQLSFIGKPLDRTRWGMTPPTVDAYEDPQTNTINFPAGILQPLYFDATQDDVINYGAEGAVVGHELTHDFDDQGRKFDVKGNLHDWWTTEDARQYDERGACIAKEYTGPIPGFADVQQNGKLTQGEDTADNGGLYLALSALSEDLKQQGKTLDSKDANGLTNLQRFFVAYGTSWCEQYRPELARSVVLIDPHSIPELRVNNVISNMPEFQKAFSCKVGQPMVHVERCRVW